MIFKDETDYTKYGTGKIAPFKLDSNLRYRVVTLDGDAAKLLSGPRPCYWLDRVTNQPLTYKDGSEAQWATLDEAIEAFVEGTLMAERNEVMVSGVTWAAPDERWKQKG